MVAPVLVVQWKRRSTTSATSRATAVTRGCKTLAVPGFVDDLRFAQQARVAVEVTLFDGQKFFTGVHDVDEEVGIVSLYEPQTFSDATTRRRVQLADITSVVVTEIDYTVD
jgi:hypothetical protein